ncbi:hypothetical protein FB451DRAFT_87174 [Mycena latifolia]|nr:hypothetical protein FB451DRAFT_87174 [Mycena latifolia]
MSSIIMASTSVNPTAIPDQPAATVGPRTVRVRLHVPFKGLHAPVVSIPVDDLTRLSAKPMKWLRFLGWAIHGTTGYVSETFNGSPVDDGLSSGAIRANPAILKTDYYYLSTGLARFVDVRGLRDCTTTAQHGKGQGIRFFKYLLLRRDKGCFFRRWARMYRYIPPEFLVAMHIIPHSKGDYIEVLQNVRGVPHAERLSGIDDPRNGLSVYMSTHIGFGHNILACLLVPNIYMSREDVEEPYIWEPNADEDRDVQLADEELEQLEQYERYLAEGSDSNDNNGIESAEETGYEPVHGESRVLLQMLDPRQADSMRHIYLPHNSHARLDPAAKHSVSPLALHLAYACSIIKQWGGGADLLAPCQDPAPNNGGGGGPSETDRKFTHSLDIQAIMEKYYSPKKMSGKPSARKVAKAPMPWNQVRRSADAWDLLLEMHLPPPDVFEQQEVERKASLHALGKGQSSGQGSQSKPSAQNAPPIFRSEAAREQVRRSAVAWDLLLRVHLPSSDEVERQA